MVAAAGCSPSVIDHLSYLALGWVTGDVIRFAIKKLRGKGGTA